MGSYRYPRLYRRGYLCGIREIGPKRKILQITAPVSEGSSGGPVFNKNGEVIGIATYIIEDTQNLNFAMPVNLIKDKISAKKVADLKNADIEDYKKIPAFLLIIGLSYEADSLFKEAIEAYKQAIKIKPDYAEAYNNFGKAYAELGMYREAIEACKQAIRIKPDFTMAHFGLGITYLIL